MEVRSFQDRTDNILLPSSAESIFDALVEGPARGHQVTLIQLFEGPGGDLQSEGRKETKETIFLVGVGPLTAELVPSLVVDALYQFRKGLLIEKLNR
jgi:hypothetical protein